MRERGADRGSAVLLVTIAGVVSGAVGLGIARLGVAAIAAGRAQTAADAAALAGASAGPAAAKALAAANGAVLSGFTVEGDDVVVTVLYQGARATARATDGP